MRKYLYISGLLLSSAIVSFPQIAQATCETGRPTCNTLGYTQSSTDCSGKATLPCPFPTTDTNKYFCGDVVSSCSYTYTAANGGYGPSCKNSSGTTVYQNKCTGVAESNCSNTFAATCISGNGTRYGLCVEAGGGGSTCPYPIQTASTTSTYCYDGGGEEDAIYYFSGIVTLNQACQMRPGATFSSIYNACQDMAVGSIRTAYSLQTSSNTNKENKIYLDASIGDLEIADPLHLDGEISAHTLTLGDALRHEDVINLESDGTYTFSSLSNHISVTDIAHMRLNGYATLSFNGIAEPNKPNICVDIDTSGIVYIDGETVTGSAIAGTTNTYTANDLGSEFVNSSVSFSGCVFKGGIIVCHLQTYEGCRDVFSKLNLEY